MNKKFIHLIKNRIITSILFAISTFAINFLQGGKRHFFVVDDAIMNNIARGGNSIRPDEHLIFINVIVGKICKWLYSFYSGINWFELVYIILIIACATLLFIIFNNHMNSWLSLVICVVTEICMVRFYTFTTISFVCTAVAIICILDNISKPTIKSFNVVMLVISLSLFFMGQMFREESFIISILICSPLVIAFLIKHFKTNKRIIMILVAVVVIISSLIKFADYSAYQSEKYKDFKEYNVARSKVVDYPIAEYDKHEKEYKKLGISKNDYACLRNQFGTVKYIFGDKNVFSKEVLEKMSSMSDKKSFNDKVWIDEILQYGQVFFCLAVGILFLICDRGKRRLYYIVQILLTYSIVLSLLFILNRPKPVVILSILFIGILNLIYYYFNDNADKKYPRIVVLLMTVVMLVNGVVLVIGISDRRKEVEPVYRDGVKIRKYIVNHEDKLFVLPTIEYNNCYHRLNDRLMSKTKKNVNSLPTADWYTYLDDYYYKLRKYNVKNKDSLLLSMTDKNVYYISDNKIINNEERNIIQQFIKEHGNKKNVSVKVVDKIKGTNYLVYKYCFE